MKIKRINFGYLLAGLLILILSVAIAQELGIREETRRLVLDPALILMLLMGVWGLGREKTRVMMIGGSIAFTGITIDVLNFF